MNKLELKVIWKLSKIVWIAGFLFWLLETSIFLTIYVCSNLLINFTKKT